MKRNILISTLIFIVVFVGVYFFAEQLKQKEILEHMQEATKLSANIAFNIQQQLSTSLSATKALGALIKQHGYIQDFPHLASEMIQIYTGIGSLQLAPKGVVSEIYPLKGNENATGDLLNDPKRKTECWKAINTGQLTLAGPYELKQGGIGIIGRFPVFIDGIDGKKEFWGFTIAVIYLDDILNKSGLHHLDSSGYYYKLWRIHPDSGKAQTFASNSNATDLQSSVYFSFDVPNGEWTLCIEPKSGWSHQLDFKVSNVLSLAFALLFSSLTFLFLQRSLLIKKNTNMLRESEAKYRSLFDNAEVGIYRSKIDGSGYIDVNQRFTDMFGYSRQEMLTEASTIRWANPKARAEMMELLNKNGELIDFEVDYLAKGGEIRTALTSIKLYPNEGYLEGTAIDITELKKVQLQFLELLELNLKINNTSPLGIIVFKEDGSCVMANNAVARIAATPVEILLKMNYYEMEIWKNNSVDELFVKVLATDAEQQKEIYLSTGIGSKTWLNFYFTPFSRNQIKHILIIVDEITERKLAEIELIKSRTELQELNATKDKFFTIISHDLKNPLGNFKNISQLLADSYNDFSENDKFEFINLMKESANSIYSLLENLLEWSRTQRGNLPFHQNNFDLKLISDEVLYLFKLSADKKNLSIKNEISNSTFVFADPNLVTTVLRNLISNSIKFTPANGTVIISSNFEDADIIISVKDNGVGMTQDTIDKLFRIDVNVSTLGTSKEKGTGLGLILCKEFIVKHGGRIWVESQVGVGSTFSFTLPVGRAEN
ncbi:MAG: hypothetical protein HW421_3536 [Ignavibacteria bacterium]|nr:hypothetical protein [Ignavibacteria bacterium]